MASRQFFDGAQSELGLLPVGDGGPGDTGLTFTDPTLFNEPFTGTNGAAWDSDWTEVYNGSTTVTIQGNKGRMAVPTADGAIYHADTVTLPTDYEIRVAIVGSADRDARVYFGTEFMTGGLTGNGHFVKLDSAADTLTLGTVVGYTDSTPVGSTTYTHAGTDTTYLHIKVRGTSCKIRAWKNAEDEPLSWQLAGTLTYTFDEIHLGAFGVGSTSNVDFDDLYVWTTRPLATGTDTSWAGSGDLVVLKHSHPTWTGDVKAIIWKHGGIGAAANNVDDWTLYPELIADGNGRFILYAADDGFGGNGAAGNDTEMASLDAVYARAQTDYPEFPKVALAGHSLGGMGIVNWAYRNTSDVAGMVGVDVILDAAQMETDTGDFILNVLDPAYGGTGTWATNASTRDPQDLATASSALRAIPFEIYDATGDSVLTSAVMSNYVTAHGANATRTTIASGDHSTVHNFIDVDTLITEIQSWTFTAGAPSGSGTPTLSNATSSGTGTLTFTGSGTPTLSSHTSSGTGALSFSGSGTPTLDAVTSSGSGTLTLTGSGTPTLDALTSAGTGTFGDSPSGTGTPTLDALTSSGTGALTLTGSGTPTLDAVTSTGTGTFGSSPSGTGTPTLDAVTSTGSGSLGITGSGTPTLSSFTATGTGALTLTGSGTPTLSSVTSSGTGTFGTEPSGTGTPTLDAVTAAGTGTLSLAGTGTPSLADVTSTGSGTHVRNVTGSGTPTLTSVTMAGTGQVRVDATGTPTLEPVVGAGVGVVANPVTGSGTPTLAAVTMAGSGFYGALAQITGRLRTRRADTARTTGRGDTARTTRRSDTPRTTRGDGR